MVIEVVDRKARPEVPSVDKLQGGGLCMHEQYLDLMQHCWATDAEARPSFDVIIARLRLGSPLLDRKHNSSQCAEACPASARALMSSLLASGWAPHF